MGLADRRQINRGEKRAGPFFPGGRSVGKDHGCHFKEMPGARRECPSGGAEFSQGRVLSSDHKEG